MYVDPSLIDYNIQIENIDGVDYIVNRTPAHKFSGNGIEDQAIVEIIDDGVVNDKCFKCYPQNRQFLQFSLLDSEPENTPREFTHAAWMKINLSTAAIGLDRYGNLYKNRFTPSTKKWEVAPGYASMGTTKSATLSTVPAINTWFYYTAVYQNNTVKLYIDGQLISSISLTLPSQFCSILQINFQANNANICVDDLIAVRAALWTSNFTPPESKLLDELDDFEISLKKNWGLIAYPFVSAPLENILKVY